jgi:2,4-dienoyl-CoA reductase-like NADH-dependent reductase (Old Yellow Enzyme family)/thioredoxin reductase
MGNFSKLFSTFSAGNLQLRNRIVMVAMGTNFGNQDGTVSDRAISYYAERAKGGAGLIITESSPTSQLGRHRTRCIGAFDDSFIPGLRRLVGSVHEHGAAIALQLLHAGRNTSPDVTGSDPQAPSVVPRYPGAPIPKPASVDEIKQIILDFGQEARRAKEAGFDAVEIHGAHGYLINQFLSPRANKRKDDYGGSTENRVRLALEVIRQVRKDVGESYPIIFRLSARELVEGGYELEEALEWAKKIERAGVDVLSVSGGSAESLHTVVQFVSPMSFAEGYLVPVAEAVKRVVNIPVVAADRLNNPELAEQILREGKADLIGVGRGFLSDPHWPAKAARGEEDRIRPCVACNSCLWSLFNQGDVLCFQNAAVGYELESQIHRAEKPKKVVVLGGGPGGMEAARVASKRGHRVTLFEKAAQLGGQMLLASIPPYKQTLRKAVEWLIREIEHEGVEVMLNTETTTESILAEKPDAVIVATGASPLCPSEFTGPNVITAWDVLNGKETGKQVVIIGGGLVGVETAEYLYEKGCQVTIVEMLDELATDMEGTTRALLLKRLYESKISVMLSTKVEKVYDREVRVIKDGKGDSIRAESTVLAVGSQSNRKFLTTLEGKVPEIFSVGDCVKPRKATEAIHEGFRAGLRV